MSPSSLERLFVQLARPEEDRSDLRLSTGDQEGVLEMASRHTVLPIVVRNLGLASPEELIRGAAFSVLLRLRMAQITRIFAARGIPFVVLKGPEFADRLYPDPALRGFTDIDLLVPRSSLPEVGEVMRSLNYQHQVPSGLTHTETYGEDLWKAPEPEDFAVEIHWNLVNSPSLHRGLSVTFEDLQRDQEGRLSPASLLLIAAVHGAASHQFDRLGLLVDVHQAAVTGGDEIDGNYLRTAAERTGATLALVAALSLAYRFWGSSECQRLRRAFPLSLAGRAAGLLISPKLVLQPPSRRMSDLRRRLFRELLKRPRESIGLGLDRSAHSGPAS